MAARLKQVQVEALGEETQGARRYRLPRQGWVSGQQKPPCRVGRANASFWAVGKRSRKGDARA